MFLTEQTENRHGQNSGALEEAHCVRCFHNVLHPKKPCLCCCAWWYTFFHHTKKQLMWCLPQTLKAAKPVLAIEATPASSVDATEPWRVSSRKSQDHGKRKLGIHLAFCCHSHYSIRSHNQFGLVVVPTGQCRAWIFGINDQFSTCCDRERGGNIIDFYCMLWRGLDSKFKNATHNSKDTVLWLLFIDFDFWQGNHDSQRLWASNHW